MKLIPLTKGKFAMVDDWNYQWLNQFKWSASEGRNTYYAIRHKDAKAILLHRVIMGCTKGDNKIIDHKDGNGLNCQESNMRFASRSQNRVNTVSENNTSSKYLGVHRCVHHGNIRWRATLNKDGKQFHCGYFKTEIEAVKAYNKKAKELHGEFANLNIING